MSDGDNGFNGIDIIAGHGVWIDLHKHSRRRRCRKSILLGSLFDDLPFPVVIRLKRYAVFPALGFHSDPTAAALRNSHRPFLYLGRMFQSLHSCSHSVSLRFLRILGNSRESFGHVISLLSGTTRGVVY